MVTQPNSTNLHGSIILTSNLKIKIKNKEKKKTNYLFYKKTSFI